MRREFPYGKFGDVFSLEISQLIHHHHNFWELIIFSKKMSKDGSAYIQMTIWFWPGNKKLSFEGKCSQSLTKILTFPLRIYFRFPLVARLRLTLFPPLYSPNSLIGGFLYFAETFRRTFPFPKQLNNVPEMGHRERTKWWLWTLVALLRTPPDEKRWKHFAPRMNNRSCDGGHGSGTEERDRN